MTNMALNTQQVSWLGIYNEIKPTINTYFYRKIRAGKSPYMTNMETIAYDEIEKTARQAQILRREDKFPVIKLNGVVTKSVTPEVLKDSASFSAANQTLVQPNQYVYINGQKVDNRTYERDRRLEKLKNSIALAQEAISTDVFLTGKYKSVQTGNTVTYTFPTSTAITVATDLKNPVMWLQKQKNKFQKDSKTPVQHVLCGYDVFEYLVDKYNVVSNKIEGQSTIKAIKDVDGYEVIQLNLFNNVIELLPPAFGVDETEIDTSKMIYIYNDNAFLPAYAGVTNVSGGTASREATDVLIRETNADEESGYAKTLAESAYCPIIVNPRCIARYNVTDL